MKNRNQRDNVNVKREEEPDRRDEIGNETEGEKSSFATPTRRHFIGTVIGGTLALPLGLKGQQGPRVRDVPEGRDSVKSTTTSSDSLHPARHGSDPVSTTARRERKSSDERLYVQSRYSEDELIRPPALKEGSTIGVVAPASGVGSGEVGGAVARLRQLGFRVKTANHLTKGFGYLSAQDPVRAAELMAFIADPEIDCVMAVRGGYGVMRILPLLDFDVIRANPKVIIGYSDITALVNAVYKLSGVIAFHGPMATSGFDSYTTDSFRRTLMQSEAAGEFEESSEFSGSSFADARASTIVSGKASGRLVGGNLSLMSDLMGTPYEVDLSGKILFLEEVQEEPYRVDRMLTQLVISGQLAKCAGVALGRFTKCEAPRRGGEFQVSLSIEQIVRGTLEPLGIPTVYGLSIGHISKKLTIPVGGMATLNADKKTITLTEPAVS